MSQTFASSITQHSTEKKQKFSKGASARGCVGVVENGKQRVKSIVYGWLTATILFPNFKYSIGEFSNGATTKSGPENVKKERTE